RLARALVPRRLRRGAGARARLHARLPEHQRLGRVRHPRPAVPAPQRHHVPPARAALLPRPLELEVPDGHLRGDAHGRPAGHPTHEGLQGVRPRPVRRDGPGRRRAGARRVPVQLHRGGERPQGPRPRLVDGPPGRPADVRPLAAARQLPGARRPGAPVRPPRPGPHGRRGPAVLLPVLAPAGPLRRAGGRRPLRVAPPRPGPGRRRDGPMSALGTGLRRFASARAKAEFALGPLPRQMAVLGSLAVLAGFFEAGVLALMAQVAYSMAQGHGGADVEIGFVKVHAAVPWLLAAAALLAALRLGMQWFLAWRTARMNARAQ